MRLRHKPWAKEKLTAHPEYVITSPAQKKTSWQEIFGQEKVLFVEVGTGKGKFLTEMAEAYPEVLFIGIEKYESVLVSALEKALETKPNNLRFILANVADLLDYFEENEIHRLFINFTDPWPKKRHAKRRLTHPSFLSLYEKVLHPEGEIHMKTDNQGLFEYSLESLSRYGFTLKNISLDLHRSEFEGNVMTEYEEKFSEQGARIYRLEAFKSR
ncbi:tRNA (guanosine(46)-N7)-methyltransferase TrmB [Aliibacillus thermotolerans]|uniref:tRNA (guanine-N(7)-)-methyltransferase n=1 Tax=Aliibacillus thermotolerans TaxID=1834418 RepID=A0ABW0UBV7_9BACI|nr:tRNA (guanosine(46)-N7)-methyltransferase TrmB [Aliibacillus thermotolerans]MDA3129757.1 tRNA (guanosine(46)-N7)-methyltransferase TrmB [Aliibacillus thermotolerans]